MKKIFCANFFFLMLIIMQILSAIIISPFTQKYSLSIFELSLFADIFTLLLPMIIYFLVTKLPAKTTLRLNKINIENIIISILIGFLFIPIGSFCSLLTSYFFHNNVADVMEQALDMPSLLFITVFAIVPAIIEELAVRGIILSGYDDVSITKSAFITGLLFAILHLNPPQFLYTFILGTLLAYLVYYTNSIFSGMLVHFIFNGTSSLLFLMTNKSEINTEDVQALSGNIEIILTIIMLLFAIICLSIILSLLKKLKRINRIDKEEMTEKRELSSISAFVAITPVLISIIIFIFLIYVS